MWWCNDCDAWAVMCVGCEYDEEVQWCDGSGNAGIGDRGGMIVTSAGHEYVGGIRGSGNVFCAADVLEMSVVRGTRRVG